MRRSDSFGNTGLVFLVVGSVLCFEQIAGQQIGTAKYGEQCERDRNCIPHAFCRVQKSCVCEAYYSPTLDRTMCIANEGASCIDNSTCRSMTNAVCRQGKCTCQDSYALDTRNSSNCISRPSREGDRCQRDDDCQEALGRAMCVSERCRCLSQYHFVNETGKCLPTRFLYNPCTKDYDCVGYSTEDVLECRNGECVCKKGETGCNKG
ncbi:PREDICTED: tenascin-like isoform X2 [Dufourea novaeangliae]|nr:PREDICTED: tenascin-like isoform X2 [Dufourea novaeangliae]